MARAYFFDLPVYRLAEDRYYKERDEHIDTIVFQIGTPHEDHLRDLERQNPHASDMIRDHLQRTYGGCWRFNEIIGYIRLHFLGSQVRGEYFAVKRDRLRRTRTRLLEFRTWKLAPEVQINPPYSTADVIAAIRTYIEDCKREIPRRFIDTSTFEAMAPFLNWNALFRGSLK